jgi:hypothetical protein
MKWLPVLLLIATSAFAASPTSTNNDDSCDVKVGPAATLLLPYFEVDLTNAAGQTTLFSVTNVTRYPQIAHVTLWTDWAFPVMTFNLFLTGYDVQSINLADVLVRGIVAPPNGTNPDIKPGALSVSTNPNLRTPGCAGTFGVVPQSIIATVRNSLTIGVFNPGGGASACSTVGGVHSDAIGYATIDLVASCTDRSPLDPLYYTTDILFDNVLIGDYQQLGARPSGTGSGPYEAGGNPMVHIRAVPEGGGAGSVVGTALPYTFYDRYTPAANRTLDRRQPLPSTFAARFIQGGVNGFATNMTIWREGFNGPGASCASYINNAAMAFGEFVRFDEHENPFTLSCFGYFGCPGYPTLPAASSTNTVSSVYPTLGGPDVGGWLYLNASNCGSTNYSVTTDVGGVPGPTNRPGNLSPVGGTTLHGPRPSQNWVTVSMFGKLGANTLGAEFDAASLGNGCSPGAFLSAMRPIGPAGGVFVCPPGTTLTDGSTTQCTGTNVNPIP